MAKLILIQLKIKNFSKTAVFWPMTVNSLVPDYRASNRETATCTITTVRPPNLKKEILCFLGPNKVYQCFKEFNNRSCPEKVESDPSLSTLLL
jgi:hypothetical protein